MIVIDDSDSEEVQEQPAPPSDPLEETSRDLAAMTEAAAALQRARDADARRAAADAAAEASAAAMVAVEAAAGAVAASFRAARDNQRLNSPAFSGEEYAALASAYYDQRASVSAAEASRSRLSAASSGQGGEGRVSTAAANAVPSPVEIARGGNSVPSAPPARESADAPAAARPALKVVFRMPTNASGTTSGRAAVPTGGDNNADAQLEEWFSHEFGGDPNASNA